MSITTGYLLFHWSYCFGYSITVLNTDDCFIWMLHVQVAASTCKIYLYVKSVAYIQRSLQKNTPLYHFSMSVFSACRNLAVTIQGLIRFVFIDYDLDPVTSQTGRQLRLAVSFTQSSCFCICMVSELLWHKISLCCLWSFGTCSALYYTFWH